MDVLTLLIADSDENFRRPLSHALQDSYYVRTCCTGAQALRLLRSSPVHVLMVDLMLPEMDGLTLLETLSREGICPVVLAVAPDIPREAAMRMDALDIHYFLRKPFPLNVAVNKLEQMRRDLQPLNLPEIRARQLLRQMHILPKYDGYGYLLHTLTALAEDPTLTITKHLYPGAAKAFGSNVKQVEHCIRHVIECTWNNHCSSQWHQRFPNHTSRPSNGDFLQTLALELRKNLE